MNPFLRPLALGYMAHAFGVLCLALQEETPTQVLSVVYAVPAFLIAHRIPGYTDLASKS